MLANKAATELFGEYVGDKVTTKALVFLPASENPRAPQMETETDRHSLADIMEMTDAELLEVVAKLPFNMNKIIMMNKQSLIFNTEPCTVLKCRDITHLRKMSVIEQEREAIAFTHRYISHEMLSPLRVMLQMIN